MMPGCTAAVKSATMRTVTSQRSSGNRGLRRTLSAGLTMGLLLVSCTDAPNRETSAAPANGGLSVAAGSNLDLVVTEVERPGGLQPPDSQSARISLPDDVIVHQLRDVNVDRDEFDEQIIAFKRRGDPKDVLRLLIADLNEERGSYFPVWEGETNATNVQTFSIRVLDLTGDQNLEIVALGTASEGQQTIDAFRRFAAPAGGGLFFRSILSLRSDVSVQVQELDRGEAYDFLQQPGASFPIAVQNVAEDSESGLDLIETIYSWSSEDQAYLPGETTEIPGLAIREDQLLAVLDGDEETYEEFLSGGWYRARPDRIQLLSFAPAERTVQLYEPGFQEVYEWRVSIRTRYRSRLSAHLRNESLQISRPILTAELIDLDEIEVSVTDREAWSGRWTRLSGEGLRALASRDQMDLSLFPDRLAGLYRSDGGRELFIGPAGFIWRENGEEFRGGYVAYRLDVPVLQMLILDENGLRTGRWSWAYELQEPSDSAEPAVLQLEPIEVTAFGTQPAPGESVRFERVPEDG